MLFEKTIDHTCINSVTNVCFIRMLYFCACCDFPHFCAFKNQFQELLLLFEREICSPSPSFPSSFESSNAISILPGNQLMHGFF
jgi:hypothetical protein